MGCKNSNSRLEEEQAKNESLLFLMNRKDTGQLAAAYTTLKI
jgi:hypothetical protein